MKALLTGGTGLIGSVLAAKLPGVRVLSRDADRARQRLGAPGRPAAEVVAWDGQSELEAAVFDGIDAVFHLAGESVAAARWSEEKKQRIRGSRVLGTQALVESMKRLPRPPAVLVCASAVGFYGDRGDEVLLENAAAGRGFLAEVCQAWEAAALAAQTLDVRVVCARTGIVLSAQGGALAAMLPAYRSALGGALGDGRQWLPWIHLQDEVDLLLHAATTPSVAGPLNACAPEPVRQRQFARQLAATVHRPAWVAAPAPLLRLAMGEAADIVLASQRAVPAAALASGFRFAFSELKPALQDLMSTRR